ncbi:hypothetical protein [Actinomadura sp. B10D3]|uniref:hypothetical protein n=1 Tax=Actinomadura sp. B10D3 TaxID=3153557 RepID=UPI00325EA46B
MAPAIGALTGAEAVLLFGAYRRSAAWAWGLPAGVAVTGAWAFVLLDRTPSWHPWLRWTVAAATVLAMLGLLAGWFVRCAGTRAAVAGLALAMVAGLAGPGAYAASAESAPTNGTDPLAGPSSGSGFGGPGGPGRGGPPGMPGGPQPPSGQNGPPPDGRGQRPGASAAGSAGRWTRG